MAVYTEVTDEALRAFLADYPLGALRAFRGIAEGVENSNFSLRTTTGDYILTLYEKRVDPADLPWFIGLMRHLAAQGITCPLPVPGRDADRRAGAGRSQRRIGHRPVPRRHEGGVAVLQLPIGNHKAKLADVRERLVGEFIHLREAARPELEHLSGLARAGLAHGVHPGPGSEDAGVCAGLSFADVDAAVA